MTLCWTLWRLQTQGRPGPCPPLADSSQQDIRQVPPGLLKNVIQRYWGGSSYFWMEGEKRWRLLEPWRINGISTEKVGREFLAAGAACTKEQRQGSSEHSGEERRAKLGVGTVFKKWCYPLVGLVENGLEDAGRKGKQGQNERVACTYIHYQM